MTVVAKYIYVLIIAGCLFQATDRELDGLKYSIIRGNDREDFTIDSNRCVKSALIVEISDDDR